MLLRKKKKKKLRNDNSRSNDRDNYNSVTRAYLQIKYKESRRFREGLIAREFIKLL